jgi:hypothetical protein
MPKVKIRPPPIVYLVKAGFSSQKTRQKVLRWERGCSPLQSRRICLSNFILEAVIPAKPVLSGVEGAGIQIPRNGFRIKACPERNRMGAE